MPLVRLVRIVAFTAMPAFKVDAHLINIDQLTSPEKVPARLTECHHQFFDCPEAILGIFPLPLIA